MGGRNTRLKPSYSCLQSRGLAYAFSECTIQMWTDKEQSCSIQVLPFNISIILGMLLFRTPEILRMVAKKSFLVSSCLALNENLALELPLVCTELIIFVVWQY